MKAREHQRNVIGSSLPVLIAEVGADERYCFVNDMYEKWYGVSPQHFVGKTVSEVLGKAKYANVQPYIRNVMSGKNVTYEDSFEYPVMINGKLRFKILLPVNMEEEEIKARVLAHETAQKWTDGKAAKRFILVPKKIINVVV